MEKVTRRTTGTTKPSSAAQALAEAFVIETLANSGNRAYGDDSPIYDIISVYGIPKVVNDINSPVEGYSEATAAMKSDMDAVISVSVFDGREAFTLAVKDGKNVHYFSLQHDKEGNPLTAGELVLAKVVLNRSFDIPNSDKTLEAGRIIFKALPVEYALKLKKAA